jgi:hypothetical protein
MWKITLAVAALLGAASAAQANCTLVGGPLNGATISASQTAGLITGTFTSPLNNPFPAGGFTVGTGPGAALEVFSIDQDLSPDYNVVIIIKSVPATYRAWGEGTATPVFHLMTPHPNAGTVSGTC